MSDAYREGYAAAMLDMANEQHARRMSEDADYALSYDAQRDDAAYSGYRGPSGFSGFNENGEPTFG